MAVQLGIFDPRLGRKATFDPEINRTGVFDQEISEGDAVVGGGGRTTKNTRAFPLGTEIGMNWRGAA